MQILQQPLGQTGDRVVAKIQRLQLARRFKRLLVHVRYIVAREVQLPQRGQPLQRVLGQVSYRVPAHVQRGQILLEDEIVRAQCVDRVRRQIEGLQVAVEAERQVDIGHAIVGQIQVSDLRVQLDRDDLEASVSAGGAQALVVAAALSRAKAARLTHHRHRHGHRYRDCHRRRRRGSTRCHSI